MSNNRVSDKAAAAVAAARGDGAADLELCREIGEALARLGERADPRRSRAPARSRA